MPIELVDLLAKRFPESSRTTLRGMIADKRVLVGGQPARTLRQAVEPDATIEILPRVEARARTVGSLPVRAVFEDRDLLVVEKPAGMLTQSGENDSRSTLINLLQEHYGRIDNRIPIGLVHRLDKDASGLLVFSKSEPAFEALKLQFAEREAGRAYRAIVVGVPTPPAGTIESKLVEYADGSVRSTTHRDHGDPAVTHYETLETRGKHSMLAVRLETGRKHQIRAHLSERNTPIVGDPIYGPHRRPRMRLMLHACELSLVHPRTQQPMTWSSPLPREMAEWWESA